MNALFTIVSRFGTTRERLILHAVERELLRLRAEQLGTRRKPTDKQHTDWLERTFEAFVEAEGWTCGGGDVSPPHGRRRHRKRRRSFARSTPTPDPSVNVRTGSGTS